MPAPTTSDELLELVRKSGVVEEKRLNAYLAQPRPNPLPAEPPKLAAHMVRDGVLTRFQAEQFLQGKWRRFTIGKYRVLDRIASGGMGSVYLCEHKFMRRRAAVKVLPTAKANDASTLERFYREARAVAALDHVNVVRAYDIDQDDNLHFLVMEYVDGTSLQDIVRKSGPLDPIRAAHYIGQAAQGLRHAHEVAGIVHRDIKPSNLIVDRTGTVKILDMGLARFFHDEEDLLTKKYDENVLGTADYLAPEQVLDSHGVDIRADVYSLGATFYFCLTGRAPFQEGTVAQKLIWHQTRQPKPVRTVRSDVPPELVAILEKMMAKDPAERFQTPADVIRALAPWTQTSITPPADSEMPRLGGDAGAGPAPSSGLKTPPPKPGKPQPGKAASRPAAPSSESPPPSPAPARGGKDPPHLAAAVTETRAGQPVPVPGPATAAETASGEPTSEAEAWPWENLTTTATPEAPAPAAAADEETLAWENLMAAAKDTNSGADTDPRPVVRTALNNEPAITAPLAVAVRHRLEGAGQWLQRTRRQPVAWIIVAGGVAILALALWLALSRRALPPTENERSRLVVSRRGGVNSFRTVREALARAKAHDHIVLLDDVEEQLDLTDSKPVTLEAEDGNPVVWRLPAHRREHPYLLFLSNARDVHLKGITFDGGDQIEEILLLFGHCPGLTLERLRFQGFTRCAVLVANCAGTTERPVTFSGLRARTTQPREAALLFDLNPKVTSPRLNEHLILRDCEFKGPFKDPVHAAVPSALDGVDR
jgi:eukaryotic-like serine/threonine-protein kinase